MVLTQFNLHYPFAGLQNLAARLEYAFAGLQNLAARLEYAFAGLQNLAARLEYAFASLQNLAARQEALLQVCKTLPHAGKRFCKLAKPYPMCDVIGREFPYESLRKEQIHCVSKKRYGFLVCCCFLKCLIRL